MSRTANVTSLDAVRALKPALVQFAQEVLDALTSLEIESRRPAEWVEHDRTRYWPDQLRRASDAVSEARTALERCELSSSNDERRGCYDEKKALQKAKKRMQLCEEKVQSVKRWRVRMRKEVEDFQVQAARLKYYLDSDFARALAALEHATEALGRYIEHRGPAASASPGIPSGQNTETDGGETTREAEAGDENG